MEQNAVQETVTRLGAALCARGWTLATAESCTGGLTGHVLTNMAGSSDWYAGGVVSYSNHVKEHLLGVDRTIFEDKGAVSRDCVLAMVRGVCRITGAGVGVALSGIAGPGGGSPEKPVGTVWIAWQVQGHGVAECMHFTGSREEIKEQSVAAALTGLLRCLQENGVTV